MFDVVLTDNLQHMYQFVDIDNITRRDQWENVQITHKQTYYVFGLMYKKYKVISVLGARKSYLSLFYSRVICTGPPYWYVKLGLSQFVLHVWR